MGEKSRLTAAKARIVVTPAAENRVDGYRHTHALSGARFGLGATFIIDLVASGILLAELLASALLRTSSAPALVALAPLPARGGMSYAAQQDAITLARDYATRAGLRVDFVEAAPFRYGMCRAADGAWVLCALDDVPCCAALR